MLNQYLTNTYQYLHEYSLFNWSFTNAKYIFETKSIFNNIFI